MTPDRYDVATVIYAHLIRSDSTTTDVAIELSYRARDPYAVEAEFTGDGSSSKWLLARDVLIQGLVAPQEFPAGHGDVSVWRDQDPEYLLVSLTAASGTALVAAPAWSVERFLAETRDLVPVGTEGDRVDAALDQLVASILAR
jgi:hypothetical protein